MVTGVAGLEPTVRESKSRALTDLAIPHWVNPRKNNYLQKSSPNWTRTSDSLINSQVLYRLSYRGLKIGEYLIFQTVSSSVPSAYECLTAVFGKGTGDPLSHLHRI